MTHASPPSASLSTTPSTAPHGTWLCTLAMVLVGSTVVVSKIAGDQVEPFMATALRHALALPVFAWLVWRAGRAPTGETHLLAVLRALPRADRWLLGLQAACGSVAYTVLLIWGVQRCGAANASVAVGTLPAMAGLFSVVCLRERVSPTLLAAIGLATAGVMALAWVPALSSAPAPTSAAGAAAAPSAADTLTGIALVLAAVAAEAVFILGQKRLSRPLPPLHMATLMSAGGLLLALPLALLRLPDHPLALSPLALGALAYYAWVPTVLGFWLWYAGARRTPAARAALSTLWMPVAAFALSVTLLHEPVSPWQWLGLALVVGATVLGARPAKMQI